MEQDKTYPGVCNCPKCDRPPVVVKTKTRRWRVACPYLDCQMVYSLADTELEAIRKWNAGEVVGA